MDSNYTCLAVISLDSVLLLKAMKAITHKWCKYIEKKGIRHINDNLSDFSSDDDESDKK